MNLGTFSLREDYWDTFKVEGEDVEFLYNFLLEKETPLTSSELTGALVAERIRRERMIIERQRSAGGTIFMPKEKYNSNQALVFPALGWSQGNVISSRPGFNPDLGDFQVIQVSFANGEQHEFASGLPDHVLNNPVEIVNGGENMDLAAVLEKNGEDLDAALEEGLENHPDFVRIAGRWFPRALLVDVNAGHLNLAEAVLDMTGGGPVPTSALLEQLGLTTTDNRNLTEFSLDLALQEDTRFDEVGPAGEVLWFLNRLEPEGVLKPHICLRYSEVEYDRILLTPAMKALEIQIEDELSGVGGKYQGLEEVQFPLIFPHWRAGTLPLSTRIRHLFPTAYEAPRIRITMVDGDTGSRFPGWVVRSNRYVYGLRAWYESKGTIPGSLIRIRRAKNPGEVIIQCVTRRPSREWVRSVLVGSDGGMVFAMLKQTIATSFDERMAIAIPDIDAIDQVWLNAQRERVPFERVLVNTVRELSKLNPQSHVHATELYAALNIVRRCPPGPILGILASRPWFAHVGDLHFRFDDSERS